MSIGCRHKIRAVALPQKGGEIPVASEPIQAEVRLPMFVKSKVTTTSLEPEPKATRRLSSVPTPGEKRKDLNRRRKMLAAKQRAK